VRSGVLVSVHSFAADPTRGIFILSFLIIIIGGALTLYAWRAPLLKSQAGFEFLSRESLLLFNNILLVIALAVVFGGTMAPLIADSLHMPTLSVGTPYFNPSFITPILPLLALVSFGIMASFKRGRLGEHRRTLLLTLGVAIVLSLAVSFGVFGGPGVLTPVGFALAFWIILTSLVDPIDRWRRKLTLSRSIIGMTVAHLGLALFVIGITAVQSYTNEHDIALAPGQTAKQGGYEFRFAKLEPAEGPNYSGVRAEFVVSRDGKPIFVLNPEKRQYWVQRSVQTEAGIGTHHGTNILIALGEDLGANKWSVRLQLRPLVNYVWIAAFVMALGGGIALTDRRYRIARSEATEAAPVAGGALGTGKAG
jgi:cytochrome c-type biogenesis protein CcmF